MTLRKILYFIFFCFTPFVCCVAQDINARLRPLSPAERVRYLGGYMETNNTVNKPEFDSFLHRVEIFAKEEKDTLLLQQVEYFIEGESIFKEKNIDTKIELIKKLQSACRQKNDLLHVGDCFVAIGQIQFANEQYAPAFENLLAGEEIFKKIGYEHVPTIGKFLHDFALDYYFFHNYKKAIEYMLVSVKLPKYNQNLDIQRYNTLGMSYLKLNQLDSALYYLNITYQKAVGYKDSVWIGISATNIGHAYYLKGEYRKALNYFLEDYRLNVNSIFPDVQQEATVNLAKGYLQLGDLDSALHYLRITQKFFPKPKNNTFGNRQLLEQQKLNYYGVSYQYYLKKEDYKTALLYADSLHRAENIRDEKYNTLKVDMASGQLALLQSKMELQKKELIHEKERRIKNIIIFSLSIIFILTILLIIFIFRNRQRLHKQKQMLLSVQLERAEHSLKLSELTLNEFAARIQEKTKLVESMKAKLKENPGTDSHLLAQLQQSTILTENDWTKFKTLFEQVHSGFLHRLKEKYPEISPAEVRYLTLSKLHFSTKEMAAALGVSTQSIRTNWYRIRKKLNLPETMNVDELVGNV